jgi:hypothetical protein
MSEYGLGPEPFKVKLEGMKGQVCAWRQSDCDV